MDRKSITVLVASLMLLLLWPMLVNRIWPPQPAPFATNQIASATNQVRPGTNLSSMPLESANLPPVRTEPRPLVSSGQPEKKVAFENKEARFTLTSQGGGLQMAELKTYPAVVKCGRRESSDTNRVSLNTAAPVPVLTILDGDIVQGDGQFTVTQTRNGARAEKTLTNGLRLVKEFEMGTNYLVHATVRIENQSSQPVALPPQEWVLGTATALGAQDDPTRVGVDWFNGSGKQAVDQGYFANRTLGCLPGTPRTLYQAGSNNVVWAAAYSQFFTLAVMPKEPAPQIRVVPVNLPDTSGGQTQPDVSASRNTQMHQGFQASFLYPGSTLEPNQTMERQFDIYAGPKEYKRLVRLGEQFKNRLDLIMDYGGFWGWFAQALLTSMNGLNRLGLSYALSIIAITVIIKLLFWPLTTASTRSMKRMAALQPQMKAIQEKFKDDPAKMQRKTMEFMKENKVSPLGGCLPMLLQIPVFFGFFRMIQSAIELRGAQFLWVCDLSKPDTLFVIPGMNIPVNPLPLLMGVTMLWQARMTPPSPGMDPMQQKLMRYMPLMFLFILYNFSAGLTLYWTVQNLLTIAQMKLTKTTDQSAAPGAPMPPSRAKRNK